MPAIAAHFPTHGLYSGIPIVGAHDCQTVVNKATATQTSGTEYLVWLSASNWIILSHVSHLRDKTQTKGFFSCCDAESQGKTGRMSKVPMTSSTRACPAFSLNAVDTSFSLGIWAGRQR